MKRILVLDGGGIRGVAQLLLLQEMCRIGSCTLSDLFDYIGGVSVGGLLACALSLPNPNQPSLLQWSPDSLLQHFTNWAKMIFHRSWSYTIRSGNGWIRSKYTHESFMTLLEEEFGERTFEETKIPICTFTYNLTDAKPCAYSSWANPTIRYKDSILAGTSAPTYFPSYWNPYDEKQTCDAGIVSNNPAEWMITMLDQTNPNWISENETIYLVSIGTGYSNNIAPTTTRGQGMWQWLNPLSNVLFQANEELQLIELESFLPSKDRIVRWNFPLEKEVDLDNIHQIPIVEMLIMDWIDQHKDEMYQVTMDLLNRKNDGEKRSIKIE